MPLDLTAMPDLEAVIRVNAIAHGHPIAESVETPLDYVLAMAEGTQAAIALYRAVNDEFEERSVYVIYQTDRLLGVRDVDLAARLILRTQGGRDLAVFPIPQDGETTDPELFTILHALAWLRDEQGAP